jgi:hypothetical protein
MNIYLSFQKLLLLSCVSPLYLSGQSLFSPEHPSEHSHAQSPTHQLRESLKHLNRLFGHITILRLGLSCVFMSDNAVVEDAIPKSPEHLYRMFKVLATELAIHCLPTTAIPSKIS